ncbi:MAG: ribonuclease III [Synergistota bacterium]|jgi:ribonuclease-3|nr:ribonuclease III [Synergistota bacterium]
MYGRKWENNLSLIQDRLGYSFTDIELLREALTHSSYAHESGLCSWNERLEFLGDAVLELATSTRLFRAMKDMDEGGLTRLRARLVRKEALLMWAEALGLSGVLRVNRGLRKKGGSSDLSSMHADAIEAIFGAVYMDGGYDMAESVVNRYLDFLFEKGDYLQDGTSSIDPKSELQQILQIRGEPLPEYRIMSREGPPHSPSFEVELYVSGVLLSSGRGRSIKEAEVQAALDGLSLMRSVARDDSL